MLDENKEKILRFFPELVRCIKYQALKNSLIKNGVFDNQDLVYTSARSRDYEDHCVRLLLFNLMKKDDEAFHRFVSSLHEIGLKELSRKLGNTALTVSKVFRQPDSETEDEPENASALPLDIPLTGDPFGGFINMSYPDRKPLVVNVKISEQFYDIITDEKSGIQFYSTRGINRGNVLIINNIDFKRDSHRTRMGANMDTRNLEELFHQMGFHVQTKENIACEEMKITFQDFSKMTKEPNPDMSIVVIMSHGEISQNKELMFFGSDSEGIEESWLIELFNNVNCTLYRHKPKIFIYQLCRGDRLDTAVIYTETDSACVKETYLRKYEDVLKGYACLLGTQAIRDIELGSWYIQLICEVFMEHAHNTNVVDMLNIVDRKLRKRRTANHKMQTSEITSIGFNKSLFFHPGIYEDEQKNIKKIAQINKLPCDNDNLLNLS